MKVISSSGKSRAINRKGRWKKIMVEGEGMFTKLIGVEKIHLNAADYEIRYHRNTNLDGKTSFTSEVEIGQNDKIILDDRSIGSLKHKVDLVLPAALYSRKGPERLGR
jgi:hypothetical protein